MPTPSKGNDESPSGLPLGSNAPGSLCTATTNSGTQRTGHSSIDAPAAAVVMEDDEEVEATELNKAFTFLFSQKKDFLRKMGRIWECRTAGNKTELIYRAYLFLKGCHDRGLNIRSKVDSNIHCPSFTAFFESHKLACLPWKEPSSIEEMRSALKAVGDKFDEERDGEKDSNAPQGSKGNEETPQLPNFTISEFARLMVLMKEDEKSRSALWTLGQELRKGDLDSGTTRDLFWGVIEGRFNDDSVLSRFTFTGHVADVDSSRKPVCFRSADQLKAHHRDAKSVFTTALDKWERSGQNDPEKFVDFLSKNGPNLYASSKRALIIFVVSKLGTPYADYFFVEMTSKTIWQGGYEAGMEKLQSGFKGKANGSERNGDGRGERSANRKSLENNSQAVVVEAVQSSVKALQQMASSLSQPSLPSRDQVESNEELRGWDKEQYMFKIVDTTRADLDRAKQLNETAFLQIAQKRFDKAMADYQRRFG